MIRFLEGLVVSDAMDKSIAVKISRKFKHPVYGKYIKRDTKVIVHDADNTAKVGDRVRIRSSVPISKRKSWMLDQVLGV